MTEMALMGLTDQERRCVQLACDLLSENGERWEIPTGPTLDTVYPDIPTPEIIVSNGTRTAAIEVKRLTGDEGYQTYTESLLSLRRALVPTCGGDYFLSGPVDFRLPMDRELRKTIAREIERVAPALKVGEHGALKVARQGYIVFREWPGQRAAHCTHNHGRSLLRPLTELIEGDVYLIDQGLDHSFVTDDGRTAFFEVLWSAYQDKRFGITNPLTWFEEWDLIKNGNSEQGKDQVWMIAVTAATDVLASVEECVDTMLQKALVKFAGRRWADLHVIVLEVQTLLMSAERSVPVIQTLDNNELADIDLILVVHDGKTTVAFDSRH